MKHLLKLHNKSKTSPLGLCDKYTTHEDKHYNTHVLMLCTCAVLSCLFVIIFVIWKVSYFMMPHEHGPTFGEPA